MFAFLTNNFVFKAGGLPFQDLVLDGDGFGAGEQLLLGVVLVVLIDPLVAVFHLWLNQMHVVANLPVILVHFPFFALLSSSSIFFVRFVHDTIGLFEVLYLSKDQRRAGWAHRLYSERLGKAVLAECMSALFVSR